MRLEISDSWLRGSRSCNYRRKSGGNRNRSHSFRKGNRPLERADGHKSPKPHIVRRHMVFLKWHVRKRHDFDHNSLRTDHNRRVPVHIHRDHSRNCHRDRKLVHRDRNRHHMDCNIDSSNGRTILLLRCLLYRMQQQPPRMSKRSTSWGKLQSLSTG